MTWPAPFHPERLALHVEGRVSEDDAARQIKTVQSILERLTVRPGLVLADEVGMGKTFVALAVAASAAWADKERNPVVVMVPSSLKSKWPRDFKLFKNRCLQPDSPQDLTLDCAVAEDGLSFLKLLDDVGAEKKQIIFLTHGALSRGLTDPWTKLAILKAALRSRKLVQQRHAFPRFAGEILRVSRYPNELFEQLMRRPDSAWRKTLDCSDDPVPRAISEVIENGQADLEPLAEALLNLPLRDSVNRKERVLAVRHRLAKPMGEVWREALIASQFASPLLILDEAHHLKNPSTTLASLFVDSEAAEDAKFLQGALKGRFERMLFLTATPFQLGHDELLNVIGRFQGIRWQPGSPSMNVEAFSLDHQALKKVLDEAQRSSLALDERWGTLLAEDLPQVAGRPEEEWWRIACENPSRGSERLQSVMRLFDACRTTMRTAETLLRPWIIRHLRNKNFPGTELRRRRVRTGASIREVGSEKHGIPIDQDTILPFLLVARSQAVAMASRSGDHAARIKRLTFVEGLASSYEAYLKTRAAVANGDSEQILDEDVPAPQDAAHTEILLARYQRELKTALPPDSAYARHPKIAATVEQVRQLWRLGEKVLVFCHFRATGRALETHIASALDHDVIARASSLMKCDVEEARTKLRSLGEAFDGDRPARKELDNLVSQLLAVPPTDPQNEFSEQERDDIAQVVRRFVRTETFLVRYFPLDDRAPVDQLKIAIEHVDESGLSLRAKLQRFIRFLEERKEERGDYLAALSDIETQRNVRRATGETDPVPRQRLLLAFNTPFTPEVLVASSVLAEGVDLHLECRYVIHHDLSWNPSTLEQRTGRVDRIGAKAEHTQRPIHVFLPYLGGTQDEKMFRVVRDRERWFQVLMGEKYEFDEHQKDRLAERIALPEEAARTLSFKLEVTGKETPG